MDPAAPAPTAAAARPSWIAALASRPLPVSTAGCLALALVLDALGAGSSLVAGMATTLQLVAAGTLAADYRKRRAWTGRRLTEVVLESGALGAVLLFVAARADVHFEVSTGRLLPEAAAGPLRIYGAVVLGAGGGALWLRNPVRTALLSRLELRPVQTVVASFGLAILAGTLLLVLPFSVTSTERVSILDALFTSTSAVCVTGLSVVDVPVTYTAFGQLVLLALIQAGGLGIMFLYAAFATLTGRAISSVRERALGEAAGVGEARDLRASLRFILLSTAACEATGALFLYPSMRRAAPDDALWHSVFHAVSAFCNAGFSTLPRGLFTPGLGGGAMAVLSLLIVAGGLGTPVHRELVRWARTRRRPGLHVRLALVTSGVLLVAGFAGLLVLESGHALGRLPFLDRLGQGFFLSVSARTAGFDALGLEALGAAGTAWVMLLMVIGASPGSTGGGLKTTTLAVLGLTLAAVLRRRREVTAFGRRVAVEDVLTASALAAAGLALAAGGTLLLLALENGPPLTLAFEAFSAFSTTGLSLGYTPNLGQPARLVVIALMFAGRLGPLTLLAAFIDRRGAGRVRFPAEPVQFG